MWGDTDPAQIAGNFFARAPPLFASKSTIGRFGECFRDGQYSLVSFLFAVFLLTVPARRAPWGHVSPMTHGVGASVDVTSGWGGGGISCIARCRVQ